MLGSILTLRTKMRKQYSNGELLLKNTEPQSYLNLIAVTTKKLGLFLSVIAYIDLKSLSLGPMPFVQIP